MLAIRLMRIEFMAALILISFLAQALLQTDTLAGHVNTLVTLFLRFHD